jgi:hypothetical protein
MGARCLIVILRLVHLTELFSVVQIVGPEEILTSLAEAATQNLGYLLPSDSD